MISLVLQSIAWMALAQPAEAPDMSLENVGITCVALAVFAEARSEPYSGQLAVAAVIRERQRLAVFGVDPCDIINEPNQFHGIRDWPMPRTGTLLREPVAWEQAMKAAEDVYYKRVSTGKCEGSVYFQTRVAPVPKGRTITCEVGSHVFSK